MPREEEKSRPTLDTTEAPKAPAPKKPVAEQVQDSEKAADYLALAKQKVVPMVGPGGLRNVFESQVQGKLARGWVLYEDYKQGKMPAGASRGHPAP